MMYQVAPVTALVIVRCVDAIGNKGPSMLKAALH